MEKLVERTMRFDGGDVHYWVSVAQGPNAPWLVFLPGLSADHRLFERQLTYFAGRANCLVWDAPSHGKSRSFALTWTYEDLVRMLHAILEREGVARPVLVGQSMGGYLSQIYLALFPGQVAGFVSIDSCPLQRSYYTGWEVSALRHTKALYLGIPWKLLIAWGSGGCATSAYGRDLMRSMMESYEKVEYCELAAHGYRGLADAAEKDYPYQDDCPTLLICGEKDAAGSARRYNRAWSRQTGLPVHWIAGAGHNSNTDAPDEVNALIEAFVAALLQPT